MKRTDLLPPGAAPCIWMTAGVVSYRLCDREYDCDHCPLDAALRSAGPTEEANDLPCPSLRDYRTDRRYHEAHTWAQPLEEGRVRCGIDAFAARLLHPVHSVILPALDSRVQQGQAGCWMATDTELLPLRSPLSGSVVARNGLLRDSPDLVTSSPYEEGWLYELTCSREAEQRLLLEAEASRRLSVKQFRQLREQAERAAARDRGGVGPTLPDGGSPLVDLRRVLGPRRYLRLVLSFLR